MGSSPLSALDTYKVRGWYNKAIKDLVSALRTAFSTRTEITGGGGNLVDGTSTSTTQLHLDGDAISSIIGGLFMGNTAVLSDTNVLTTAIYTDGTPHSGDAITLGASETAYVTLIVTDSNGSGGSVGEDGTPIVLAIIAGTDAASAKAATDYPTSGQIDAALAAATGVHDGATGWAHYAAVLWDDSPAATPTLNRNNVTLGL